MATYQTRQVPNWQEALSRSSDDFQRLIQPIASKQLHGHFEIVESVTASPVAKALDTMAGVDIWFVHTRRGIRGVANRVQRSAKCWRTFTVRKERDSGAETEYAKRKSAIDHEWLYPVLTLQGYVSTDGAALLGFGVARTRDIIAIIDAGHCSVKHTGQDNSGQASFYVVGWDDLIAAGHQFVEWPT